VLAGSAAFSLATAKSPVLQDQPKPTSEHKLLEASAGVWDGVLKMPGPDSDKAGESKGVETNTMMLGGFWLVSSFKGTFAGQPFEGTGVTGYDPNKKKYVATWSDSMSPELSVMEGTYDERTKTMTMTATVTGQDGKPTLMQTTSKQIDADTRQFTMGMKGDSTGGKLQTMFEIHYKRRAK
jgi:hypothetical protein